MRAVRPRSSLIDRIVYDEDAGTLAVTFRNARRYIYSGVPRAVYDAFKKAGSAGTYFNDAVKGHFPCRPAEARRRYPLPDG
jgi:hypothetical protein